MPFRQTDNMHRTLFQPAQRLNRFFHPSQRMGLVRHGFEVRRQPTWLACEILVPEPPPKGGIPCGLGIDMARSHDKGAESVGISTGLIHTQTRAPGGKRTKPQCMEAEIRNLLGNQSIFARMVGTDLVEPTGRTGEIRLNHPMAWPVGSRFMVIDMAD